MGFFRSSTLTRWKADAFVRKNGFSKMALKVEIFKYGVLCMSDLLAQLRLSWTEFTTDMCQLETAEEAISQFLLKMYMAVHVKPLIRSITII
jgi:hypothetical protein